MARARYRDATSPTRDAAVAALLVCSGAAALAYEVLWARDFALAYGATAPATAVVLAAYFAGLALGAVAGGRLTRAGAGLRTWAALEAAVAALVLSYVALRPGLGPAAVWMAHAVPPPLLPAAHTAFAFAVLLAPTTVLGASLPVVAGARSSAAARVGRLYAWNTLGGAAGALAAGMLLVRWLGVRGTFVAAAGVDAAVALGALALARGDGQRVAARPAPIGAMVPHTALAITAAAGFAGLAAEVLWTRGLAGVLSDSIYSVALVLAGVLLGLVAGAALASRLLARGVDAAGALGWTLAVFALATLGSSAMLRALPAASVALARTLEVRGLSTGLAAEALLALLVVLPPATALGAAFPLVVGLVGAGAPAHGVGPLLAANTAGGIAGALAGGFVLLPRLGLELGLCAVAAVAAVASIASARRARAVGIAALLVTLVVAVAAPVLPLPWRAPAGEQVLFYRDGATATVAVTDDTRDGKRLRVNGQYSLGGGDGLLLEAREAHIPLLLHPAPARLLALGIGTGDTLGAALTHPGLQADGVELVADVLGAAALFGAENGGLLASPRARLVVGDARTRLAAARDTYDVVLSDLFLPWTAGTATLYSRDFYAAGLAHLGPGGLYCQWLPLHQLAVPDLESIVATFVSVFPEVQLWLAYHRTTTPLAALIGSRTPIAADATALRTRLADPTLARATAAVGLDDPADLAALYVTDGRHLRVATAAAPLVTDDRPGLEFTAPAAYFHQQGLAAAALAWVAARLDPAPAPVAGAAAGFDLRRALLAAQLALLAGDGPGELRAYLDAWSIDAGVPTVRRALTAIAAERRRAGDARTADMIGGALDVAR